MDGDDVSLLDGESGGHRIQRVPLGDKRGRVHSSTVTVTVIDPRESPDRAVSGGGGKDEFKVEYYSGTGAGGQHRNRHPNSCRIQHRPTGLTRSAQTRSRENSYRLAMEALLKDLKALSESERHGAMNGVRRDQAGSGERSDKRRTYRFQEDRVVDHVTGRSASCSRVMAGESDLLS